VAEYIKEPRTGGGTAVENRPDEKLKRPRRYKVVLHNDHYTTMDFVIYVLQHVFRKPYPEAERIMLDVHQNGLGVAGVYIKSVAEQKVATVHKLARKQGHPLRSSALPE